MPNSHARDGSRRGAGGIMTGLSVMKRVNRGKLFQAHSKPLVSTTARRGHAVKRRSGLRSRAHGGVQWTILRSRAFSPVS